MWTTVTAWLIGTRAGRSLVLALAATVGAAAMWFFVADHYREQGRAECEASRAADTNAANVAQGLQNAATNALTSQIGLDAARDGDKVATEVAAAADTEKGKIHVVYRDPPATAPVAPGSCVHPVDKRVQHSFEAARAAAIEARAR